MEIRARAGGRRQDHPRSGFLELRLHVGCRLSRQCGAYSCPPHVHTVDERTPNAYEPAEYKQFLGLCIDENTLEPTPALQRFRTLFFVQLDRTPAQKAARAATGSIVLKHALQSFMLPVIMKIEPNCRFVVVSRPFAKIESTRARRNCALPMARRCAKVYGRDLYVAP